MMGAFHVDALSKRIQGAQVTVVNDFFADKAGEVARPIGARVVADPIEAINDPEVDAVLIATPGKAHDEQVNACLDARQPGAVREAADHRHRVGVRDRAEGGGARPAADPGRLHAPLRRRVRRAEEADHRRWSGQPAGGALHAPQPGRAGLLQLRVHDPGLGRARGRRGPVPAGRGDHQRPGDQGRRHQRGAGGHHRPDDRGLRDRVRPDRHRRDLRPHRRRVRGAHRGRRRARQRHHRAGPEPAGQEHRRPLGRADHPELRRAVRRRRTTSSCSAGSTPPGRAPSTVPAPGTATPRSRSARPASRRSAPARRSRSRWSPTGRAGRRGTTGGHHRPRPRSEHGA